MSFLFQESLLYPPEKECVGPDQSARTALLIWVYTFRRGHTVGFLAERLTYTISETPYIPKIENNQRRLAQYKVVSHSIKYILIIHRILDTLQIKINTCTNFLNVLIYQLDSMLRCTCLYFFNNLIGFIFSISLVSIYFTNNNKQSFLLAHFLFYLLSI